MSHSTHLVYSDTGSTSDQRRATIIHNSDWSGTAHIVLHDTAERIAMPGRVLQALVESRLGDAIEHVAQALDSMMGGR